MTVVSRFERKYHLSPGDYVRMRNIVRARMRPDEFTRRAGGRYLVRSVYYDTRDFSAFHERNNGDYGRIKLRVRVYSDSESGVETARVELKTKKGNSMEKYSSFVSYADYLRFCREGTWPGHTDPVLAEFERIVRVRALQPILLVQYHREGFRTRDGTPVRLTLDHNVHSARATELFPQQLLLKPHRPKNIVLEIKAEAQHEPEWMRDIVRRHSLKQVANSKYVQGIEIIRPHMATPRVIS